MLADDTLVSLSLTPDAQRSAFEVMQREWQRSPLPFIENVLGNRLWPKQAAIAQSVWDNPRTAVKSCHGSGKTYLGGQLVPAFLFAFPYSRIVTTAPTYRQVVKLLWSEIRRAINRAKVPLGGTLLTSELRLDDGWEAVGYTSDDPDAFQGVHSETGSMLVVVDEAAGVDREILTAIDGILTGENTHLLQIGNPTDPTSAFADEFRAPGTKPFTISAFDTPNLVEGRTVIRGLIDQAWVDDKKTRWGIDSPAYIARVLGEFPELSDKNIFLMSWLFRAKERDDLEPEMWEPVDLGFDVARQGFDSSVLYAKKGKKCWRVFKTGRQSTMRTVGMAVKAIHELQAAGHRVRSIRIDDIGLGGGPTDRLLELLPIPVIGVNVGRKPRDRVRFFNKKAEFTWHLRDAMEHGYIQIDDNPDLIHQATTIQYDIISEGKIKVESKEKIKSESRPSPDDLDALILAWADIDSDDGYDPGATENKHVHEWAIPE